MGSEVLKGQSGKKETLEMVWSTGQDWTGLGDSEGVVVHTLSFLPFVRQSVLFECIPSRTIQ